MVSRPSPRRSGARRNLHSLHLTDLSSNHLSLLTWALERQGKDASKILGEIGINTLSVNDPVDRVPLVTVARALEHIQRSSGDPCFGLKLYGNMKLAHLNVLGFALACSSSLLDFFERARRFSSYVSSAFCIDFSEATDHFQVRGSWAHEIYNEQLKELASSQLLLECAGYSATKMVIEAYGEPLPIMRLFLPGQPHEQVIQAFADVAQAPILVGNSFLGADIRKDVFCRRLPGTNPSLARASEQQLVEHLAAIEQTDIVWRCERLILEAINSGGGHSLKEIAERLGKSERALKQGLREHDQNFSTIVSHLKKNLAMQHLREGKKSISQIAYQLGFDSASNFSRAFRSWTGISPRDFRHSNNPER